MAKNKQVSKIKIHGNNYQKNSYDRSIISTPDSKIQNDIIGKAIGINVKSRDVGTGIVADTLSPSCSPNFNKRPVMSPGEGHFIHP